MDTPPSQPQSFWQRLYGHTEFWLIALVVGVVHWSISTTYLRGDDTQTVIILQLMGVVEAFIIVYASLLTLARRERLAEEGVVSMFESFDRLLVPATLLLILTLFIIYNALFVPMWVLPSDHMTLRIGYDILNQTPLLGGGLALLLWSVLIIGDQRTKALARLVIFSIGLGLVYYVNFFVMYGGDDSPDISLTAILGIMGAPLAVLGILSYQVVRKPIPNSVDAK